MSLLSDCKILENLDENGSTTNCTFDDIINNNFSYESIEASVSSKPKAARCYTFTWNDVKNT